FAVKFLFSERQFLNFFRAIRPRQQIRNDEFVLHPKAFLEVTFRQGKSGLSCQAFPAFFVMQRRVDDDSIPIKNGTFHSGGGMIEARESLVNSTLSQPRSLNRK